MINSVQADSTAMREGEQVAPMKRNPKKFAE